MTRVRPAALLLACFSLGIVLVGLAAWPAGGSAQIFPGDITIDLVPVASGLNHPVRQAPSSRT